MQRDKLESENLFQNENSMNQRTSFALSPVGSLYFGPNPSTEARRLLEQAKELLRENERIQNEKEIILREEAELKNRKVYLSSENTENNVFQPNEELQRMVSETITLSDEGKHIDRRKEQLQLYYAELKRRKEFLQSAIKIYEESELGYGVESISSAEQFNPQEITNNDENIYNFMNNYL